jgi:hypothetical protein
MKRLPIVKLRRDVETYRRLRTTVWYQPKDDRLNLVWSIPDADIGIWNVVMGWIYIGEFD